MIKKVLVTLLVTVDTEDEEICPTGDPLIENVVLNHIEDGFIDPVEEIYTSHISDYVEHLFILKTSWRIRRRDKLFLSQKNSELLCMPRTSFLLDISQSQYLF